MRIKVTTSGSIGSGSVPVIPPGVDDGAAVDVEEDVEVGLVVEANAGQTGPANNTESRTNAALRLTGLNIEESPFPAQMCAARRLDIAWVKSDVFLGQVAYVKLLGEIGEVTCSFH